MHWRILAVGKPSLRWAHEGVREYERRLGRLARVEVSYVREGPRDEVEKRFARLSDGWRRVVLDERGRRMTTQELREVVDRWELDGCRRVALMIGGADGHSGAWRAAADDVWSLSSLTLQHEVALVVLLEQIYRVYTIKRGEPYHRE